MSTASGGDAPDSGAQGLWRILWETVAGRRTVEDSGPWLKAFRRAPAPVRDVLRWILRPQRRFLLGRLRAMSHGRVMSGPFAGMQLAGLPTAPELLGCYERELYDVVHALAQRPFRRIVNLGARHGYYAIGLALVMPQARVIAFEGDREAQGRLHEAILANGVGDRVTVRGYGDVPDLIDALGTGDDTLLVCDIDGGEVVLLDPSRVPMLARTTILVECHTLASSSTEPVMATRFLPTHNVRRIATAPRELPQLPAGLGEPWRSRMPTVLEQLMQEHRRGRQAWLELEPRARREGG